jgi:hypothetical protein
MYVLIQQAPMFSIALFTVHIPLSPILNPATNATAVGNLNLDEVKHLTSVNSTIFHSATLATS